MLPTVRTKVQAYETLVAKEDHKGILELLSRDRNRLPPELNQQWLTSARATPSWWSDRAEQGKTNLTPRLKPILTYLMANALPQSNRQQQFETALKETTNISDGLESASASLVLAQEFARRGQQPLST